MIFVTRSYPPPSSLAQEINKKNGKYNLPDVIWQLQRDFHGKCYICEMNELQDPEVEHLLPHKQGKLKERMFDWDNLFWSCGHCNGIKNKQKYEEKILNCCRVDPERKLLFCLTEDGVLVKAIDGNDEQAVYTAMLISEVFQLMDTGMRVYGSALRLKKLQLEMNVLYDNLEKLKKKPESKYILRKLKALLSPESAFAAFKRNYVREHIKEYGALRDYVDYMKQI